MAEVKTVEQFMTEVEIVERADGLFDAIVNGAPYQRGITLSGAVEYAQGWTMPGYISIRLKNNKIITV